MKWKKLPIGVQSFEKMRSGGYCYADKTHFIERLAEGCFYLISRPRRFGKSLLLDTIDCAFSGKRELFEGLHLTSADSEWVSLAILSSGEYNQHFRGGRHEQCNTGCR